ncbi:putative nuclease HARBI1 [Rhodamnia argentea]|uniref:Nuclease HARBI1 n=1 Tax=Rhodamnia argentea TaxID=178133 RepID=A0ABM3HVY8_9MYRT|nr:putative nuclease HARBI1 [Rhodamnia argentea]
MARAVKGVRAGRVERLSVSEQNEEENGVNMKNKGGDDLQLSKKDERELNTNYMLSPKLRKDKLGDHSIQEQALTAAIILQCHRQNGKSAPVDHFAPEHEPERSQEAGFAQELQLAGQDCVGAIDGTQVRASIPLEIQGRFCGRKEGTIHNVLAAVTFDLRFSYILDGWEGTAHDSCVLADALSKPNGLKVPRGKYYLADVGYGIQSRFISPYHGAKYHLKEFGDRPPKNEKELFNLRHSSLRMTVERAFRVSKKHFLALDSKPFWSFETQVDVVLACCIIHNFIMGFDPNDPIMEEMNSQMESQRENPRVQLTQREEKEENRIWASKRDRLRMQCVD